MRSQSPQVPCLRWVVVMCSTSSVVLFDIHDTVAIRSEVGVCLRVSDVGGNSTVAIASCTLNCGDGRG